VNHPSRNRLAGSKPHQLKVARSIGFDVPATLISNDSTAVRAFAAEHQPLICKPLGEGRIEFDGGERLFFTSRFEATASDLLDDLGPEPYLFQELVDKNYDLRVTVIGEEVFAVRIESQVLPEAEVDWRRAGVRVPHVAETLPSEVVDRCLALVRGFELEFAAIDLVRARDDRYVFLELNPNGQWAWLEQLTGVPLRASLANLLEGGGPS
jgi:glutathione synthase/RimK-type ligase-like ATP-grasp enzyme